MDKSKIFLSKKNFLFVCKTFLNEKYFFLTKIFGFEEWRFFKKEFFKKTGMTKSSQSEIGKKGKNKNKINKMEQIFLSNDGVQRKYSCDTIKSKHLEKEFLQSKYGLEIGKKKFILGFTGEITSENFGEDFLKSLEILLELDVQICLLAKAEKEFQEKIGNLHQKFSNKFLVIANNEENLRDVYAISDSVLFLGVNDNLILSALSYVSVPVILNHENLKIDLLEDFDPLREIGNSFFVKGQNFAFILEAILRAKETYRFSYDWGVLKNHCVNTFKNI